MFSTQATIMVTEVHKNDGIDLSRQLLDAKPRQFYPWEIETHTYKWIVVYQALSFSILTK